MRSLRVAEVCTVHAAPWAQYFHYHTLVIQQLTRAGCTPLFTQSCAFISRNLTFITSLIRWTDISALLHLLRILQYTVVVTRWTYGTLRVLEHCKRVQSLLPGGEQNSRKRAKIKKKIEYRVSYSLQKNIEIEERNKKRKTELGYQLRRVRETPDIRLGICAKGGLCTTL